MKPGDEVECIRDYSELWHSKNKRVWKITPPVLGARYTVRSYCANALAKWPSILLVELKNPEVKFSKTRRGEASFSMEHFRVIKKAGEKMSTVEKFMSGADPGSDELDNRRKRGRFIHVVAPIEIGTGVKIGKDVKIT